MSDKADWLDELAEADAKIEEQAKEIRRLEKEGAELRDTIELERQESHRRWQWWQAAKKDAEALQKQFEVIAADSPFAFKIVYSEFVDGELVRSCRGVDPQVLDARDSGAWLVKQLRKMVDEVRQPPATEGGE